MKKKLLGVVALMFCSIAFANGPAGISQPGVLTKQKVLLVPDKAGKAGKSQGEPSGYLLSDEKLLSDMDERSLLVKALEDKEHYSVGLSTAASKNGDGYYTLSRYMPMFNYLSDRSGSLFTFVPMKDAAGYNEVIKNNIYDFLYTDAVTAVSAIKFGYRPLVKRSVSIQGAWVVKDRSVIKDIDDLMGKKVGAFDSKVETILTKFILNEKKMNTRVQYLSADGLGLDGLVEALNTDAVDSIVLDLRVAKDLVRKSGGTYRILNETSEVPEAVLLVKKGVADKVIGDVTSNLISIKGRTLREKDIVSSMGSEVFPAFGLATFEDLLYARKVVESVGLKDVGSNVRK